MDKKIDKSLNEDTFFSQILPNGVLRGVPLRYVPNKPGRYIGQEYNIIKKTWSDNKVKICLCYPDVYEVGMSNLGLKILYHILNRDKDIICERSFTPWHDMERFMFDEKSIISSGLQFSFLAYLYMLSF